MSHSKTKMNRRGFGGILAGVGAGAVVPALAAQQIPTQQMPARAAPGPSPRPLVPDTPPFEGTLEFTSRPVAIRAEPFPMKQVRLLGNSIYADAHEWNRGYMARLEADRLLYTFRANAGLPVGAAKPLGGWEQPENGQRSSELRGHFPGHFLSASAQLAANGDKEAQGQWRLHGCGTGEVPAEARWQVSQRVSDNVVGSLGKGRTRLGAVLHDP